MIAGVLHRTVVDLDGASGEQGREGRSVKVLAK